MGIYTDRKSAEKNQPAQEPCSCLQLCRQVEGENIGQDLSSQGLLFPSGCRSVSHDKGETEAVSKDAAAGRMVRKTEWIFNQKAERKDQHRDHRD